MRIYLAWPTEQLAYALEGAEQLHRAGHVPVMQTCAPQWTALDRKRVESCDCLVRLPGESSKADFAVDSAKVLGLPVYFSLQDCIEALPCAQVLTVMNELFDREETPTIMDGLVIRWTMKVGWASKPEISASRNGVGLSGHWPILHSVGQIDAVERQLGEAFVEHLAMKRRSRL